MLRDEGVAELLPSANTVIFDEAHQLPDVAGLFFGEDVSTSQLIELARDCTAAHLSLAKDCVELGERISLLEKACKDFRLVFAYEGSRMPVQKALALKGFQPAFEHMLKQLQALSALLETQAGRDPLLENAGSAVWHFMICSIAGRQQKIIIWCAGSRYSRSLCSCTPPR